MSNVEADPAEVRCHPSTDVGVDSGRPVIEVLRSRSVPLGGPRSMPVARTLPQRALSLIGAWCFADHYGPVDVSRTGGMDVAPHPHTGLQTVSWLFAGEVEHRDSAGVHELVRPGELNLMTGGSGICHSEVSTERTSLLHGVQLWVALPEAHRDTPRGFEHYVPEPTAIDSAEVKVFLGALGGSVSPVPTFSPLLGAELTLPARTDIALPLDPAFEHGVLVDSSVVSVSGIDVRRGDLAYAGAGATHLRIENPTGDQARMLVLGGRPFDEEIVMWWNFVARSHEEIVAFREAWQRESDQFGQVSGYRGSPRRLPAPAVPKVRIRPRRNRREG